MLDSVFIFLLLLASSVRCDDATIMAKFDQLEARLHDQEIQLKITSDQVILLEEQVQRLEFALSVKSVNNKLAPSAIFTPRTCQEARDSGLPEFKESGMYWIDPDGLGIGVGPIYVFCNMTTGVTSIGHDSESIISIPKCIDPGCYFRTISYPNVSLPQLKALADISADCRQSISINCVGGPLTLNDINYAWWNDVDNKVQNFWSGSDESQHICQCKIEDKCIDKNSDNPQLKCNCDANVAIQLNDDGVITLKEVLPVTKLNFGRTSFDGGSHKLGKFECSGKSTRPEQLPTSCKDLWRIGHITNGFYPVRKAQKIELVYCDFTPGQNVNEKQIGLIDIKSKPVYFYVGRLTSFSEVGKPIRFDVEQINEGQAMDKETGIFTAPKSGIYSFDFSGVGMPGAGITTVDLFVNDEKKGSTLADDLSQSAVALPSIFHLNEGDQVKLEISLPKGELYSKSPNELYTHFTGHLLEEEFNFS